MVGEAHAQSKYQNIYRSKIYTKHVNIELPCKLHLLSRTTEQSGISSFLGHTELVLLKKLTLLVCRGHSRENRSGHWNGQKTTCPHDSNCNDNTLRKLARAINIDLKV